MSYLIESYIIHIISYISCNILSNHTSFISYHVYHVISYRITYHSYHISCHALSNHIIYYLYYIIPYYIYQMSDVSKVMYVCIHLVSYALINDGVRISECRPSPTYAIVTLRKVRRKSNCAQLVIVHTYGHTYR
jgi:hypothetical protein